MYKTFLLPLSLLLLATPSFAVKFNEIEETEAYKKLRGISDVEVYVENNEFCILSRSGGGDSGGGIPGSGQQSNYDPSTGDPDTEFNPQNFFENLMEGAGGDPDRLFEVADLRGEVNVHPLEYDVLSLLSCKNGIGIPESARRALIDVLLQFRSDAIDRENADEIEFLDEILSQLTAPQEV